MNYIFCGGYKGLLFALYIKKLGKEITIITSNKDTIKYCRAENIKFISFKRRRISPKSVYKIFSFKKRLDEVLKEINIQKDDCFFMTGLFKSYDFFYLAKNLSKIGKGYYKITGGVMKKYKSPWYKPIFVGGGIVRIAMKFVLGLDMIYYRAEEKAPFLGINQDFLKKYNIKEYEPNKSSKEMFFELTKEHKIRYGNHDNLFIDDDLLGITKTGEMEKFYEVFNKLSYDVAIKRKPLARGAKGEEDEEKNAFPVYVPVELLFNSVNKNVISICSTALIPASQLGNLNVISLINLVEWNDEAYKKQYIKYLEKESKNKILFPKSFEEFEKLLKTTKDG